MIYENPRNSLGSPREGEVELGGLHHLPKEHAPGKWTSPGIHWLNTHKKDMYSWSAGSLCLYGFECASELSIHMTATRCVQHIQLFYKTDINSSRHNLVHNRICELNRPCGPVVHYNIIHTSYDNKLCNHIYILSMNSMNRISIEGWRPNHQPLGGPGMSCKKLIKRGEIIWLVLCHTENTTTICHHSIHQLCRGFHSPNLTPNSGLVWLQNTWMHRCSYVDHTLIICWS